MISARSLKVVPRSLSIPLKGLVSYESIEWRLFSGKQPSGDDLANNVKDNYRPLSRVPLMPNISKSSIYNNLLIAESKRASKINANS